MKTKNNVQKTIFKSVAVVTSLVLISLTVNAQYYWKSLLKNYDFNEIELALLDNTVSTLKGAKINYYESLLEQESENTMELESWMTNENYFYNSNSIPEAFETSLTLENWMTNEALFSSNSVYSMMDTEKELKLENWMLDENRFEDSVFQVIDETEKELKIETWMMNENFFEGTKEAEQPLKLEAWMISEEIW
jgi:hypothetical protein